MYEYIFIRRVLFTALHARIENTQSIGTCPIEWC